MKNKPLGFIAYEGPSRIDGAPIVVIVTALESSANDKTGNLAQSFILCADVDPVTAANTGNDATICGQCRHRPALAKESGAPLCYVNKGHAPLQVFKAYKRGRYTKAPPRTIARALTGLKLRIGTYGDPAAAPVGLWEALTQHTDDHTGYTHQWKEKGFDHARWARLAMASADSLDDAALANLHGMRAFRVSIGPDRQTAETICPASTEAGKRTQCAACMLCAGTSKAARDIVIQDHGPGYRRRVISIATA
jgi:hypothetical protein